MSGRRYFDHAATSFPKPPCVAEAMARFARELGASPGRGAYRESIQSSRIVQECRERIAQLIHHRDSPNHIVFTLNATDALNLAIKGIAHHHMRAGRRVHIITSWLDHNSVLRPLRALESEGVEITRLRGDDATGIVDADDVRRALRRETALVAMVHGSNVTGALQPIEHIGPVCREMNVPFLVDAAQTLGHVPIDVQRMQIDLLAFPGHKGLLGPLGTGGLAIRAGLERFIDTTREGGTGSHSEDDVQPEIMPDKFEAGSHNTIGLAGLNASVAWILEQGVETLWQHERALMQSMVAGLQRINGVRVLGLQTVDRRCGVFSFTVDGMEPSEVAAHLEDDHGVLARSGLHCAPLAHELCGTLQTGGTTRVSLGAFHTEDDVRRAVEAIAAVAADARTTARTMVGA